MSIFGSYTVRLFVVLSLSWAILQTTRFVMPTLLPTITSELRISPLQAGIAMSAMETLYALGQYPGGRISDQLSRMTVLFPALVLAVIGIALISMSPVYATLLLGLAVFGLGNGLYAAPARAFVTDRFVHRPGRALGIFAAGTDVGGLMAGGLAVVALTLNTWRLAFFLIAGGLLVVLVALTLMSDEAIVVRPFQLEVRETLRRLLVGRQLRTLILVYVFFFFAITSMLSFLPTLLQVSKGLSPAVASSVFALLFGVGILVKPVAGFLSDRFGPSVIGVGGLLLSAAAMLGLVLAPSLILVSVCVVGLAIGYKTQFPIMDGLLLDIAAESNKAGDLGASRSLAMGAGSLGPIYVGLVAQQLSYGAAFLGLALCLLISALLLLSFFRSR